jgi:glycine/D-amino acid oxidase-like deaminating enzyme
METADVVIVGSGIVGASIAYHLTEAGFRDIILLERESHQGKGSTGKSMGGVRAQFATPVNIQMSLYSIPFYSTFEEVVGYPSGYRPQGYLFMATTTAHMDYLRTNYERQVALGLKSVALITREEILERVPHVRSDDIVGGSFCSTDGFVDPHSVMTGFTLKAVERGARLWLESRPTGLSIDRHGIAGVETTRGLIATRTVVNAAGPWAAAVAELAGLELPVRPQRRMLVPTEPFDKIPHSVPMVIDMSTGFHFRPEGLGLLMAWNDPDQTYGFNTQVDRGFIEKILTHAVDRFPVFEDLEVNPSRAWAGLYEVSPDHHCILGPVKAVPGLYLANGFSGHGVMHSPATGRILSDLISQGHTSVVEDATVVNFERFAEHRLIEETAVL